MVDIDEGPTPAGGDTTVAYWWDADGLATTADRAVSGEIVEYLGGVDVRRTYLEPPLIDFAEVDYEVEDADLIKGTWDLYDPDGELVTTLPQLRPILGEVGFRRALGSFMATPAWVQAPAELRLEANAYLVLTRPGSSPQT